MYVLSEYGADRMCVAVRVGAAADAMLQKCKIPHSLYNNRLQSNEILGVVWGCAHRLCLSTGVSFEREEGTCKNASLQMHRSGEPTSLARRANGALPSPFQLDSAARRWDSALCG